MDVARVHRAREPRRDPATAGPRAAGAWSPPQVDFTGIVVAGERVELRRQLGARPDATPRLHGAYDLRIGGPPGLWWHRGVRHRWSAGASVARFEPGDLHGDVETGPWADPVFEVSVPAPVAARLGVDLSTPQLIVKDEAAWGALRDLRDLAWCDAVPAATRAEACRRAIVAAARAPRAAPRARAPEAAWLGRVREHLENGFQRDVPLDELCEVAQLSKHHLCRSFRDHYGVPPHAFQLLVRIEHARRQLQLGHSSTRVAFDVGFTDQPHFTRHFRRALGVTPGQYARQVRGGATAVASPLGEVA